MEIIAIIIFFTGILTSNVPLIGVSALFFIADGVYKLKK